MKFEDFEDIGLDFGSGSTNGGIPEPEAAPQPVQDVREMSSSERIKH